MGAPLVDVRRLLSIWKDDFDWRKIESELNELRHFHTSVQCDRLHPLDIHFVHQRDSISGAIPLLFCHACEAPCWTMQVVISFIVLQGRAVFWRSRNCFRFSPMAMAAVP